MDELLTDDNLVLGSLKSSSEFGNGAVVMVCTSNNGIYYGVYGTVLIGKFELVYSNRMMPTRMDTLILWTKT